MFAHGFNIHFGQIVPPYKVGCCPWSRRRRQGTPCAAPTRIGGGTPCLVAVHQGGTRALKNALAYAKGIGRARAPASSRPTSRKKPRPTCSQAGGVVRRRRRLVKAAFKTLTEAGYAPEMAYFECMHELKLIVDLFYRGGLNFMRYSVDNTAEWGDYVSGPRIITPATKKEIKAILKEIQNGKFAKDWINENKTGRKKFNKLRAQDVDHPIEKTGMKLRHMMPWLNPREVKPGAGGA